MVGRRILAGGFFCSQPYHTQGTRRYLTRCIYSAYPGKSLRRKFSSSRIRQTSTGKNGTTRRMLHHEPSASGIAKSRSNAPEYIGCRTYAYGPVDTTGCPSSTRMEDAAYLFDCTTTKNSTNDSTIIALAITDTTGATGDQPKRWSNAGSATNPTNPSMKSAEMSF